YPFEREKLARLVWHFDFDYADGRDPSSYTRALGTAIEWWREQYEAARLELRDADDRLEIADTRPCAAHPTTVLRGPARLAYLALDAGNTADGVRAALERTLGDAAPPAEQLADWLEQWRGDRLVMQEGAQYLSLATNSAERVWLPAERIAA